MNLSGKDWWHFRHEDLISLGTNEAPLYVYNEETLNDILFDLLNIDTSAGLLYPFHANFHLRMLQKAFDMDVHFRCNSLSEAIRLKEHFPKLASDRIYFYSNHAHVDNESLAFHHWAQVALGNLDDTLKVCKALYRGFSDISTLVLGNEVNGKSSAHKSEMDLSEIENFMEKIHDACPQFELRLELPFHLISYVGALLVEALESGTAVGRHTIRTHLPMSDALHKEIHGSIHQVINLSSPHDECAMTRISPCRKHTGDGILYLTRPCSVERGDVLLLTHMGTYGPETRAGHKDRNGLTERYLKARCLCPVKL